MAFKAPPNLIICGFVILVWVLPLPGWTVLDESFSALSLSAFIFKMGTRREPLPSSQGYYVDVLSEEQRLLQEYGIGEVVQSSNI